MHAKDKEELKVCIKEVTGIITAQIEPRNPSALLLLR
jgi:hypothetical protein